MSGDDHRGEATFTSTGVRACGRLGDRAELAWRTNRLGTFEAQLGFVDAAAAHFAEALAILGEDVSATDRAPMLNNLALIHGWQGRYRLALELADESMRLRMSSDADSEDRAMRLAQCCMTRSYLLIELERYEEARAALADASRWCPTEQHRLTAIEIASDIVEIARATGDTEAALTGAHDILRQTQELGLRTEEALARNLLGTVHVTRGEPHLAIPELEELRGVLAH